jgi:hypothetical protein
MNPFAFSVLALSLSLGACAVSQPPPAQSVCRFQITDAAAWINRMPGPGGPSGNLVVSVEVADDGISRRFEPSGMDRGTLSLDVVEWGPREGIGKIVYRARSQSPERIDISCEGQPLTALDVQTVY